MHPSDLKRVNPTAEETLKTHGYDAAEIAKVIRPVFAAVGADDAHEAVEVVTFDPNQGQAMLRAEISQIAHVLVRILHLLHSFLSVSPLLPDHQPAVS